MKRLLSGSHRATAGLLALVALSALLAAQAQAAPPDAPGNLTAKVDNAQVILKWETPSNGGSPITGYEYRQKEGTWTRSATGWPSQTAGG